MGSPGDFHGLEPIIVLVLEFILPFEIITADHRLKNKLCSDSTNVIYNETYEGITRQSFDPLHNWLHDCYDTQLFEI